MTSDPMLDPAVRGIQRRTVGVLFTVQIVGSVAVAAGIAMGGLLMAYVTGSDSSAGFAQAASTLGSALIAIPAARIAFRSGRRASLSATYVTAAIGAATVVTGAALGSALVVLLGMLIFGGGTAGNLQLRFAGTDLAAVQNRGRMLSLILWAVTLGGAVGPNLATPTSHLAAALGLPELAGPLLISAPLFAIAAVIVFVALRPDPLLLAAQLRGAAKAADQLESAKPITIGRALRKTWASADGWLGLLTLIGSHATMVSVMVMTPVHIGHLGHSLTVVGVVISLHVVGMYAFSPLVGILADRVGPRPVAGIGGVVLIIACMTAATAPADRPAQLAIGLLLLGAGWSFGIISGSLLVSGSATESDRPAVQGASDLVMGLGAASAAVLSGPIVDRFGFATLAFCACALALPALLGLMRPVGRDGVGLPDTVHEPDRVDLAD